MAGPKRIAVAVQPQFQHTATRRWLGNVCPQKAQRCVVSTHSHPKVAGKSSKSSLHPKPSFNTQPPEGGWALLAANQYFRTHVSTHSHPKVAGQKSPLLQMLIGVSTHSHPKVAGLPTVPQVGIRTVFQHTATRRWLGRPIADDAPTFHRFNTQPPEGGWLKPYTSPLIHDCFNTQPPEGGWFHRSGGNVFISVVSTHSHPKVAGTPLARTLRTRDVSTHSHPKVAGVIVQEHVIHIDVSTHSHPKVAGLVFIEVGRQNLVSTHSHPKVAGPTAAVSACSAAWFQHTATRRWLEEIGQKCVIARAVSTHSHPKVAGL